MDATFSGGNATLVVAVRDDMGNVVRAILHLTSANSAREAKIKAIDWVSGVA